MVEGNSSLGLVLRLHLCRGIIAAAGLNAMLHVTPSVSCALGLVLGLVLRLESDREALSQAWILSPVLLH